MEQVECPWCGEEVVIVNDICPSCRHEVLLDRDGQVYFVNEDELEQDSYAENLSLENIRELLLLKFKCSKCEHEEAEIRELAMTGTGLSKLLYVQYNHYLFISCCNCGYVEIYDPNVLTGKNIGTAGTLIDIFFG
ncbi:zinc ribbon domain-containing protein [Paenibacillus sp. IITD108]|uniref:zinc ribbon domain-containing protein n=1 Tax=Paenibacillus sp. IITD108 TaxID=3116649 RepID=UPI002F42B546